MPVPLFKATGSNGVEQDMLAAYDFNIVWYEKAARLQRTLHFVFGLGIILGQIATLSSFAFEQQLPSLTSPALAGLTSALIAIFGFLSPTAKWRDFRTAQFELMAQRVLFCMDVNSAADVSSRRAVIVKYIELGMRVINATASSYWRQIAKSAEQLKATGVSEGSHGRSHGQDDGRS
jgi:hypothetical protein